MISVPILHPRGALNYDSLVHSATRIAILLLILSPSAFPQSQSQQKQDPDRLGMTCAQILQMSSSDWIAKFTGTDDSVVDGQLRGIRVYGACYDARTDRLAASLAKTGKGPLMGARGDFQDFEKSIQDFTAKALAAMDPPAGPVKSAYAALYEKQFRYAFYQQYAQKSAKPAGAPDKAAPHSSTPPTAPKAPGAAPSNPAPETAPSEMDDMNKAKNRFGELLGLLPDDKRHDLHAAFGEILGLHSASNATQLAVYRYAIFILEPSPGSSSRALKAPAKPFAPPPF
jgi:hypothetical protein